MKPLLRMLLLSSVLLACNNSNNSEAKPAEVDTASAGQVPLDSALKNNGTGPGYATPQDPGSEAKKEITEAIISSKNEINLLESDISDSLSKTGLSPDRRSLFAKTIKQLDVSSEVLNRQLEQILVSDLQNSREKLTGIITRMKTSENQLSSMIHRLDKISTLLATATNLIQTLPH